MYNYLPLYTVIWDISEFCQFLYDVDKGLMFTIIILAKFEKLKAHLFLKGELHRGHYSRGSEQVTHQATASCPAPMGLMMPCSSSAFLSTLTCSSEDVEWRHWRAPIVTVITLLT
ncbi:hypothetical protein Tco_0599233 [Tanacetum coccineum]